jgi:hypothetical protein
MKIEVQIEIAASKEDVWRAITNIEGSADTIGAIEQVEVLERPDAGLVGLKWRETRNLFGKTATEVMWITDAAENQFYQTRAESHGSVYVSRLAIAENDAGVTLTMGFEGTPQTTAAKLMSATMGKMFKGATEKALRQDLQDIKAAVEGRPRA